MSKATAVILGGIATFIAVCGITVGMIWAKLNNEWVTQETSIEAQYQQNQNSYDTMVKTIVETAQVPEQYAKDIKEVYTATLQGRYGANGSTAVMQMIQEKNPELDASMYKQVQQVIEAGRKSFSNDQKTLLDKVQIYRNDLKVFPNSIVARVMGFPTVNLDNYKIVTSVETQKAFDSKQAAPLNVFSK